MNIPFLPQIYESIKDHGLKVKNLQLEREVFELKKSLERQSKDDELSSKLIFENNHYYLPEDTSKLIPHCSKCWDSNRQLIKLHKGDTDSGVTHYSCPNCKTDTSIGRYTGANSFGNVVDY